MGITFKLRHHQPQITLGIAIIIMLLILTALFNWLPRTEFFVSHYYHRRLDNLAQAIQNLPQALVTSGDIKTNLHRYDQQLEQINLPCRQMLDRQIQIAHTTKLSAPFKATLNSTRQLCRDLTTVTDYSKTLYSSAHDYLALSNGQWPMADSTDFRDRLRDTSDTITQTRQTLANISYPEAADPALPELTREVGEAEKLVDQAKDSLEQRNYTAASNKATELTSYITKDRQDFLNARSYFWNNTVRLDQLQKSIKKLRSK